MKIEFFSQLLIALVITFIIKASVLLTSATKQASYKFNTFTTPLLIDSAYAQDTKAGTKAGIDSTANYSSQEHNLVKQEQTSPPPAPKTTKTLENQLVVKERLPESANLSSSELQLLKELSKRRQQLEKSQDDIEMQQQILKVTENKIDQKMHELKSLQAQLEELMQQYEQKEQAKILSLVKIYENMKPKDAAKIFDELEMSVLLQVVTNMREIKVAPVIASMNILKARDLSIELAKRSTINN